MFSLIIFVFWIFANLFRQIVVVNSQNLQNLWVFTNFLIVLIFGNFFREIAIENYESLQIHRIFTNFFLSWNLILNFFIFQVLFYFIFFFSRRRFFGLFSNAVKYDENVRYIRSLECFSSLDIKLIRSEKKFVKKV